MTKKTAVSTATYYEAGCPRTTLAALDDALKSGRFTGDGGRRAG
ncbi:MAG: hypothetical protein R2881_06545 [Eubacteriales bacterium]